MHGDERRFVCGESRSVHEPCECTCVLRTLTHRPAHPCSQWPPALRAEACPAHKVPYRMLPIEAKPCNSSSVKAATVRSWQRPEG